jgi:molybdate transport system regulatory protein
MKLKPRTRLWMQDEKGGIVFGGGRDLILRAIESTGSMNKAAKSLGMSYRTIWGMVHDTERRLGFKLIDTATGGSSKSGSRLTDKGKEVLGLFEKWRDETIAFADRLFTELFEKKLKGKAR